MITFSCHNRDFAQTSQISPNSSHMECIWQTNFDTARLLTLTTMISNTLTPSPSSSRSPLSSPPWPHLVDFPFDQNPTEMFHLIIRQCPLQASFVAIAITLITNTHNKSTHYQLNNPPYHAVQLQHLSITQPQGHQTPHTLISTMKNGVCQMPPMTNPLQTYPLTQTVTSANKIKK